MERRWSNYINRRFGTRILSKWIVLCFDVVITAFTYGLTYILRYNFNLELISFTQFAENALVTTIIFTIAFLGFQSYDGIIRHSGEADARRLVLAGMAATIGCLLISIAGREVDMINIILPASIAIIHASLNIAILLFSRYVIKVLFFQATRNQAAPITVLIYGAGRRGLSVLQALKRDSQHNYHVAAFLDDNAFKINKSLEGLKIHDSAKLPELLKRYHIQQLIISIHDPHPERKTAVVEACLQYQVMIKSVPPVDAWINGKLSTQQIRNFQIEDLLGREPIYLENEKIEHAFRGKTILITGAAGSIGGELVRQLLDYHPGKLLLLDQAESALYDLNMELYFKLKELKSSTEYIIADITHEHRLEEIFTKYQPQVVFHAAAYKHVPLMELNPVEAVEVNVLGTMHLVDLAIAHRVEQFIMISTDKAVNPTSVMGASKRAAEIYVQEKSTLTTSTRFITTRFGNVLGSNGSAVHYFNRQIEAGGPLTITHPEVTRYFMTIPEACQLVLEAAVMGRTSEIYMFDMGEPVKILDLATKMVLLSGLEPGKDIQFLFTGLRPGEKLHEELTHDDEDTLPTHHEKIRIAIPKPYPKSEFTLRLRALQSAVEKGFEQDVVSRLKQIVPEYISQNSAYTALDTPEHTAKAG